MRAYFLNFTVIFLLLSACAMVSITSDVKSRPEHVGVDSSIKPIVDTYMHLSALHHIQFKNSVSIGFKKINRGNVIGLCTYGDSWREIDIDSEYFKGHPKPDQLSLVFHELTHCYCGRDHDFGEGKLYPDENQISTKIKEIFRNIAPQIFVVRVNLFDQESGYMYDGCPLSLMRPIVVSGYCLDAHYAHYTDEMFERCKPW